MNGVQLYQAGFKDLVSVIPPGATISKTSSLTDQALGKIPGVRKRDGTWVGYDWLKAAQPTEAEVAKWDKWGANIGLKGTHFPALDIDVDNPKLSLGIETLASRFFGDAPVRLSRGSRRLLMLSTSEPFGRVAATLTYLGKESLVEFLGDGRQYLVAGTHPSGASYEWQDPWIPGDVSLPPVNRGIALEFLEYLKEKLEGKVEVAIQGSSVNVSLAVPQSGLMAPSVEALREAVAGTPNHYPDRDSYIRYGTAIKAAAQEFEDEGYLIFLEWANRWEGGDNDDTTVLSDWERMRPPFRIGWEFIRALAGGYAAAADAFTVLPEGPGAEFFAALAGGGSGAAADTEGTEGDGPDSVRSDAWAHTDTWVAENLAVRLAPVLRYVPEAGHWHVWNGHAWALDRLNRAEYLIRQALTVLAREVGRSAGNAKTKKDKERGYAFAAQLYSRGALTKAVPELQAHPALTLTVESFDADPWVLNTPDGILDLRTGVHEPSDPARLLSKSTAVASAGGESPLWDAFLSTATGGDVELAKFLQKQVGYALTGVTTEQSLCFIHGPPRAGKSVFANTIAWVLGTYHETASAETFAQTKGDRHPTDLASLAGSRLVTAVETQEGRAWDTQRVKALTGGDRMVARFMRQDFFEFTPTFKIMIVGNFAPEVKGADEAMLRRIHIVPFEHSLPEDQVDPTLATKLKEEGPGILAWAVEGTRLWLKEGMTVPEAVRERTARYKEEEDPVGAFIEQRCQVGRDTYTVSRQELFSAWREWCNRQGEEPGTLKQLKRRFDGKTGQYGYRAVRLSDATRSHGYRGLALTPEEFDV